MAYKPAAPMGRGEPRVVKNTFHKGNADFEYETPPKGKGVYGLVTIKNTVRLTQWGEKDSYRLVFRLKDNPNCFLTYEQTASLSERSNLGKALKRMTGAFESFNELSPLQAYDLLMGSVNKWYEVNVRHVKWTSPQGEEVTFAKVEENEIFAAKIEGPSPEDFFRAARESGGSGITKTRGADLSGYPDKGQPQRTAPAPVTTLAEDSLPESCEPVPEVPEVKDPFDIPF